MTNYKYCPNTVLISSTEPILSPGFTELPPSRWEYARQSSWKVGTDHSETSGEYRRYLAGPGATIHLRSFPDHDPSTTEDHTVSEGTIVQVRDATILYSKPERPLWEVVVPRGTSELLSLDGVPVGPWKGIPKPQPTVDGRI